jgi:hypothetical protein
MTLSHATSTRSVDGEKPSIALPKQYAGLPRVSPITLDEDLTWKLANRGSEGVQALLPSLKRVAPDGNTAEGPLTNLVAAFEDIYVICHYVISYIVQ